MSFDSFIQFYLSVVESDINPLESEILIFEMLMVQVSKDKKMQSYYERSEKYDKIE
jgi:hypothetical protein